MVPRSLNPFVHKFLNKATFSNLFKGSKKNLDQGNEKFVQKKIGKYILSLSPTAVRLRECREPI